MQDNALLHASKYSAHWLASNDFPDDQMMILAHLFTLNPNVNLI